MSRDPLQEEIRQALEGGRGLRRRLPWGRLHLDRPVPFLLLYRRPPANDDPGTSRLLTGEAAYLLAETPEAPVAPLVRTLLKHARARFGAAMLVELWADAPADPHAGPAFRLVAPRRHVPTRLLETMEDDLLAIRLRGKGAQVMVEYREHIAPPGLPPVLEEDDPAAGGVVHLGLAVRPIYRNPRDGTLYPFALAHLHRRLSHALRHAFFVFLHEYTAKRPVHFHQLGRRHLSREIHHADQALADIGRAFDLLLHVTPVNAEAAWQAFRTSGFQRAPEFLYRPREADPALLKRRLHAIPLEAVEDPALGHILEAKRDELDLQLSLYGERGGPRFLTLSRTLFGEVETELRHLAETILARLPATRRGGGGPPLPVETVARRAREMVDRYRAQDPGFATRVAVREDVTGILVSRGDFLIGADARVSEARLAPALAHEIGTHCLTYHNGGRQPLAELQVGMAGYEALQEGLAVLAEYLLGGLGPLRLRQLAARVLAVDAILGGADFVDTYRLLRSHGLGGRAAFTTTLRVFRGGGYTKDVVYLRGLRDLLDYLGRGGDLELLYVGKVALEFIDLVEELRWRRVLRPPALRPHHLQEAAAQARLRRLQKGMSLLQLAEEIA